MSEEVVEVKSCETCGIVLKNEPRFTKRTKYCSVKCSAQARTKKISRCCVGCGASFQVKASIADRGEGLFCSRACYYVHKDEAIKRDAPIAEPKDDVKLTCTHCGAGYTLPRKFVGRAWAVYCSDSCIHSAVSSSEASTT